jgi:hypothetical protein
VRLNRSRASSRTSSRDALTLDEYGLPGLPPVDPALPGESVDALAREYVEALGLDSSVRRDAVRFAVECVLDDEERRRDGRPTYEDEILGRAAQ